MDRIAKLCWRTIPSGWPPSLQPRHCSARGLQVLMGTAGFSPHRQLPFSPLDAGRHLLPSEVHVPPSGTPPAPQPESSCVAPQETTQGRPCGRREVQSPHPEPLSVSIHVRKQVTTACLRDAMHSPQLWWAAVRLWPRTSENAPLAAQLCLFIIFCFMGILIQRVGGT